MSMSLRHVSVFQIPICLERNRNAYTIFFSIAHATPIRAAPTAAASASPMTRPRSAEASLGSRAPQARYAWTIQAMTVRIVLAFASLRDMSETAHAAY